MDSTNSTHETQDNILYLTRKEVIAACQKFDCVEVIRQVFRWHALSETHLPDEAYLGWTNAANENLRSLNMPGYIGGELNVAGTKIINSNPANLKYGLPRASGLTLLYDTMTARVLCIMEAAYLSSLRTACVTALATELCAGPKIETIALLGAGVLAEAHITLLLQRQPQVRHIRMYDLQPDRVYACRQNVLSVLEQYGVEMTLAESAQAAIEGAELIVPVTTTTTGYIQYSWLKPGAILVHVSLDDALPEVVFQADKVIVDDWNLVKSDSRRLLGRMYRAGQIVAPDDDETIVEQGQRKIDAQIGDLVLGTRKGREREDDIILVNPFGLSIEDIGLAAHVYRIALEHQLGCYLER